MRSAPVTSPIFLAAFATIAIFFAPCCGAEESPVPPVDTTIARGLDFLAAQQNPDGSFSAAEKPTTTALALMSFLACGHTPNAGKFDANVGKFGSNVRMSIDYLVAQAQPDGSLAKQDKLMPAQAIVTLALAQAYGVDDSEVQRKRIATALLASSKLIVASLEARKTEGRKPDASPADMDLVSFQWMLAALRACQDVGIVVPRATFQRAAKYVLRCYNPQSRQFSLQPGQAVTAGATGAGVLCMHLLDPAQQPDMQPILATLVANPVDDSTSPDVYASLYFASQAAFQAGDATWRDVAKVTFDKLIKLQQADGGWPDSAESTASGRTYTTSMALLALSIPYRLLPANPR